MANEKQDVLFAADAGTYTLTFGGDTTTDIDYDDDAAAVQAALEALASIGSGNVSVSSITGGFRAEFVGSLANTNVGSITANSSLKQSASTVATPHTQTGIADTSGTVEIQSLSLGGATTGTFDIQGNSTSATVDANGPGTGAIQTAMDTIWGPGAVTVTGTGPFTLTWNAPGARAQQTIGSNTTDGNPEITTTQEGEDIVSGRPEIFTVTLSDSPTEGQFAINVNGAPSLYLDFDATAAEVEAALEASTPPYPCGVTGSDGGPWTVTSDSNIASPTLSGQEYYLVAPLRKAAAITISVYQQGSAMAQTSRRKIMQPKIKQMLALKQLTSLSSAAAASSVSGGVPTGANGVTISTISKDVFVRCDGTAPTSSAYSDRVVADTDSRVTYVFAKGYTAAFDSIKLIEQGASATANLQFFETE